MMSTPPSANPSPQGSQPVDPQRPLGRFRWHHLYYGLAGFDLLTIVATLVLGHVIMGIFVSSIDENQEWAQRLETFHELNALAGLANEPGNRLFLSRDIEGEARALEASERTFAERLVEVRTELHESVEIELAAPLLTQLGRIEDAFGAMVAEAELIISDFRGGETASAGGHMTRMDLHFYALNAAFSDLQREVWKIQDANFRDQAARADSLRKYELVVAFVVVLILIGVTRYGHLVSRAFQRAEETNRRYLDNLRSSQKQLEDARRNAERANAAKSQFLANMSHEIRTPMTAILGFAENCLDPRLPAIERQEAIQTILRNGDHLLRLINDILDISKIEAGQLRLERLHTPLQDILQQAKDLMEGAAAKKELGFSVEFKTPIPQSIETDPTRLRQALINLIGNAIKFTQEGEVRVEVALIEPEEGEALLEIAVEDTGIGISRGDLLRLFEPFAQADDSMTRRFGGTGLGLAISRQLCRELGGELLAESTVGEGSRFVMTVATGPLEGIRRIETLDHVKVMTDVVPQPETESLDARILVAEDGPDNQQLIAFILEKAGARVMVVENGREAVDAAWDAQENGNPFDLIVMDMQMPVLDGYTATGELRSRGYHGAIVALTAHAMSDERERCLASGCDDYASKPIDRRRLVHCIATTLERVQERDRERARVAAKRKDVDGASGVPARSAGIDSGD